MPTYLPTPAICVPTETRCAPNHHSRAAQVSSSWWNAGAPRPHPHQEWAHPGRIRICTGNGLTGNGLTPAHLHRDRAAVAMLKQSVNSSFETPLTHGILHERHIFYSTFSTVTLQHRIAHAESRHSPTSVLGLCAAPQTFILSHSRDAASDCRKTRRRAWPHLRRSARLRSRTTERSCHQHERAFCATDRASQTQLKSLAVCQTTLPLEVATVAVMFTSGAR